MKRESEQERERGGEREYESSMCTKLAEETQLFHNLLQADSAVWANIYTQVPGVVLSLGSALDHQKKGWRLCGYTRDKKHSALWLAWLFRGHINSAVTSVREIRSSPFPPRLSPSQKACVQVALVLHR